MKCPVCGKTKFESEVDCDICKYCGWENDGTEEPDNDGEYIAGANDLPLPQYIERYNKFLIMKPDYIWKKDHNFQPTRKDELKYIHHFCSNNKKYILNSKKCGCFYCEKIFEPKEIISWIDEGKTAECPYCGIDSVLPDSKIDIEEVLLAEMYKDWF